MENTDVQLLPRRYSPRGNVVAKWAARNAAALALSAVLAVGLAPVAAEAFADVAQAATSGQALRPESLAPLESTAVFEKSEVVYADLDASGAPSSAYVVNRFDVEEAGRVVDYGEYDLTKNLTTTDALSFDEGVCSMELDAGTFYYQGNMAGFQLPWEVSVGYALDGEAVEADALAGKSGRVGIHMTTSQNPQVDPAFFDSFLLQVTFTLDGSKCSHVQAEGATVASAGADQTVAFTALPGSDGDFLVEMDAEDFEMAGIQIAALPYSSSVEIPDTSGMTDGMQQLADGVSSIAAGSGALSGSGSKLVAGAEALSSGVEQAADGAGQIEGAGASVVEGASEIGEAIGQQAQGLSQLDGMASGIDTSALAQASPEAAAQIEALKAAISQMSEGMSQLDAAYSQYESGVEGYVAGAGEASVGFEALKSGAASLAEGIRGYVSGMEELDGGIQSLDSETSKLPATMSAEIDSMLEGFDFPEFDPVSFVSPQNANVKSVQFVMTTPDIKVPEAEEPEEQDEGESTFGERLLNLFR